MRRSFLYREEREQKYSKSHFHMHTHSINDIENVPENDERLVVKDLFRVRLNLNVFEDNLQLLDEILRWN